MSDYVITIVGGGASSVSLIDALLEGLERRSRHDTMTIFLLEKREQCGRGLAYAEDVITNLLNTRAEFISPFTNKPGHFYKWLLSHRDLWEDDFPTVDIKPQAFLPRPLFGHYLAYMARSLSKKAIELGCRLIPSMTKPS